GRVGDLRRVLAQPQQRGLPHAGREASRVRALHLRLPRAGGGRAQLCHRPASLPPRARAAADARRDGANNNNNNNNNRSAHPCAGHPPLPATRARPRPAAASARTNSTDLAWEAPASEAAAVCALPKIFCARPLATKERDHFLSCTRRKRRPHRKEREPPPCVS